MPALRVRKCTDPVRPGTPCALPFALRSDDTRCETAVPQKKNDLDRDWTSALLSVNSWLCLREFGGRLREGVLAIG